MAQYIPIGAPANRSEADGIRIIRDVLPEHDIVIGNFELQLPRRKNTLEYDAVVITDYGVYAVEIKGWGGKITGDVRRWQLKWGRVENPFIRIETKAKALRDLLARQIEGWPAQLFCESLVLLAGKNPKINLDDPRIDRLLIGDQVEAFFEQRAQPVEGAVKLSPELKRQIAEVIAPVASPRSVAVVVQNYEILAELERDTEVYREYVARHTLLRTRNRVRLKVYALDPLMTTAQRDRALRRILRDIEALNALGDNPYVARAYDMAQAMEDELLFYVVSEWVGSRTMGDFLGERQGLVGLAEPSLWRMGAHLLRAVSFIHAQGVVHRDLHPGVVYMSDQDEKVPLKIVDFDFARIARMDSIADGIIRIGTEGYVAPELWFEDEVYDQRVDVFSVGAILFELLTGKALNESATSLMRHEEVWQFKRLELPEGEIRALFDHLLSYDPASRAPRLDEAIALFERYGQGAQAG